MKVTAFYLFSFLLALALPVHSFAANFGLTNAQFLHLRGVNAVVGEITDVKVLSSDQYAESGIVEIHVSNVLAGTITVGSTVHFAYQRTLSTVDEESNWDVINPKYVSLQNFALGRPFLFYLTENKGDYSLATAGNAVQDVNDGVLLGTVERDERPSGADRSLQIKVERVLSGWLPGTEVTLSFQKLLVTTLVDSSESGAQLVTDVPMPATSVPNLQGKKVLVAFDKNGVTKIKIATDDILKGLTEEDQY